MITIAFFFLLRPSEYVGAERDYQAFTISDVALYHNKRLLLLHDDNKATLRSATSAMLLFKTQKNAQKGQYIAHGRNP